MVNLLGAVVLGASKTLLVSLLTERVILKLSLALLECLEKSSSNSVDDWIVLIMCERLKETSGV